MLLPKFLQLRTQNSQLRTHNGFSLVELLIALVLITFTVFIFLKATDTLGRISRTNHQTIAFHIASRKIDSLRGGVFAAIPQTGAFTDSELTKLPRGAAVLTVLDYQANPKIKEIEAKVTWFEKSEQKEVKLRTLISENGLHK